LPYALALEIDLLCPNTAIPTSALNELRLLTFYAPKLESVFIVFTHKLMLKSLRRYLLASIENPADAWIFLALAGSISMVLLSIAISQILLAVAMIGYVWNAKRPELASLLHHPIFPPLLAFIIWTIVASLVTPNPLQNLTAVKKLLLYLLLLLIPAIVRRENQIVWIYKAVFAVVFLPCIIGILQYILKPDRDLLDRIKGTMSHWMTYSGELMLVFVMLIAYALCIGLRNYKWLIWLTPLAGLLIWALILTQTRNAWLGAIAAAFILLLLRQPRAAIILIIILLLAFFVMPSGKIKNRITSTWDPKDDNTRNRIELYQTSLRLIEDHPWFGVGYKNVQKEAQKYRGIRSAEFPDWMYQHMHNNFLQIAAERGIPGLLIWTWLMLRLAWDALRAYRSRIGGSGESLIISTAALGAWVAFIIAGLFEYNFGDSEVLTLFLFIMSAPYVFRQFQIPDTKFQTRCA
jgi:putative inorganic carbon (hco3(-)) transporter